MGKRQIKQTISLMMAMLLCITSFNFNLLASAAEDGDRIISFVGLEESVSTQTLPLGATLEDIKLPDSLKAIVETVEEVEVVKPIEKARDVAEPETSEEDEAEGAEAAPDETIPEDETKDEATEQPEETSSEEAPVEEATAEEPVEETAPVEEPVLETAPEASAPEAEPVTDSEAAPEASEVPTEPVDTSFLDILFPAMVVHAEEVEEVEEVVTAEKPTTAVAGVIATSGPVVDIQYETIKEKKTVESEITIGNVKWKIQDGKVFDSSVESSYVFVPEFKTDYVIAAVVPSITVNIVNANKKMAFEQSIAIDGVRVLVKADAGVFPEGATLSVSKVSGAEEKAVEDAVDEKRPENKNVVDSYTFDIKVLDKDGNEIEPDTSKGQVKVSFTLEEVANDNLETDVYHVKGEVGALAVEELETKEVGATTVEAATDGFSYYTVEFTYNELQYVLDGDTSVALTEILAKVGLSGNIEAATSSNPELFTVEKKDDVWTVAAVKAFISEETLKVTLDGVEYEIKVTDDTEWVEVADAAAFQSAVNEGKNVKLTADITLTSEIAIGGESDANKKQIIIDGNGKTVTSDGELHRAICLNEYATVAIKNLTISGFSNGQTAPSIYGTKGEGGAIMIYRGTLVLDGCTISSNKTTGGRGGGAIKNRYGKLYAVNTTFENNLSTGDLGGAIASDGNTYLYMCTFTENSTTGSESYGGALQFTSDNKYRIISCTFTNNSYGTGTYTGRNDIAWTYDSPSDYTIAGCGTPTGDSKNLYLYPNTGLTTYEAGSAFLDYSDLSNIVFVYTTEAGGFDALIGNQGYSTFSAALSAWDSGETLKVLKDVSYAGPITIKDNADKTFDLNGCGIRDTSNYSAFKVLSGKLTIIDSNPTKKHSCVIPSDGAGLATVDEEVVENDGAHSYFYGGYITGENYDYSTQGGAIYVATGATLEMKGGNLVGNKATSGGAIYSDGTATLDGVNLFGNEATVNGGAILITQGIFTIKNGNVFSNLAVHTGGIHFSGSSSKLIVENCELFSNNDTGSTTNNEQCGAIFATGKELILKDVTINENIGTLNGGVTIMSGLNWAGVPQVSLSGKCEITGNQMSKKEGDGNLYLTKNAKLLFPDGDLTAGSEIGIRMEEPGNFTTASVSKSYFNSDNPDYIVLNDTEGLKIGSPYTPLSDETPVTIYKGTDEIGTTAPVIGDTLTVKCDATGVTYQWYFDGVAKSTATSDTYTVEVADAGKRITVKATQPNKADGTPYSTSEVPTKDSAQTAAVAKKTGTTPETLRNYIEVNFATETVSVMESARIKCELAKSNTATKGESSLNVTEILDTSASPAIYYRACEQSDTYAGPWVSVGHIGRGAAPEGFTTTKASSTSVADGSIIGTTNQMEYKTKDTDEAYRDASNTSTAVKAGTYLVRIKATSTSFASKTATIVVGVKVNQEAPAASLFTIKDVSIGETNDGEIRGFTDGMEYYDASTSEWVTMGNGDYVGNLVAGEYKVRYAGTADANVSPVTTLTVKQLIPYRKLDDTTPVVIYKDDAELTDAPLVDDVLMANCEAEPVEYAWYRDGQQIEGVSSNIYQVTLDDIGYTLKAKAIQSTDEDEEPLPTPITKFSTATKTVEKKKGVTPEDASELININYGEEAVSVKNPELYELAVSESDTEFSDVIYVSLIIEEEPDNRAVYVRTKETADTSAGPWRRIQLSGRDAAPTGLVGINATRPSVKDGKIQNTTGAMEYSPVSEYIFVDASKTPPTALAAATYLVRYKAVSSGSVKKFASKSATVVVGADKEPTFSFEKVQVTNIDKTSVTLNGALAPGKYAKDTTFIKAVGFRYKKASETDDKYITVSGQLEGDGNFTADLTNLETGTTYEFYPFFITPDDKESKADIVSTFTTKKEESTDAGKISITVTCDSDIEKTLDVIISVEKGSDQIDSVRKAWGTSTSITALFEGLPDGFYNVVCRTSDGKFARTELMEVKNGGTSQTSFNVTKASLSTVVEAQGDAPQAAVSGLNSLLDTLTPAEKEAAKKGDTEIEFKLELKSANDEASSAAMAPQKAAIEEIVSPGLNLTQIFDMSLWKNTTIWNDMGKDKAKSKSENIGAKNNNVLQVVLDMADKMVAAVFRHHADKAEELTKLDEMPEDGSQYQDNSYYFNENAKRLHIFASGFSVYAIAEKSNTPVPSSTSGGATSSTEAQTVPVYRLYNTATGEHLFTMDALEKANLLKSATGWTDEGIAWYASSAKVGKPVYRLLDMTGGTGHIYTTSELVKSEYVAKGWRDEGPCWYAPAASGRTVYVVTDAKTGKVLYTTSQKEKDTLQAAGYTWQEAEFTAY